MEIRFFFLVLRKHLAQVATHTTDIHVYMCPVMVHRGGIVVTANTGYCASSPPPRLYHEILASLCAALTRSLLPCSIDDLRTYTVLYDGNKRNRTGKNVRSIVR
jgi:hypothetical protein